MFIDSVKGYVVGEAYRVMEFSKCGVTPWSAIPTVLWGVGIGALAHRMLTKLFRRSMFRRAALWEYILQDLLYIWVVIYSIHFWVLVVKVIKVVIEYFYNEFPSNSLSPLKTTNDTAADFLERKEFLQQWVIWVCAIIPIFAFIVSKPRQDFQPMMIWITTSAWQRREMGAYGYYLSRPPSSETPPLPSAKLRATALRRAFSDTDIPDRLPPARKTRHSKSC